MSKWYRLPIFIALCWASASAQGISSSTQAAPSASAPAPSALVAPPHPSWLSDVVVFEFLFKHVMLTESHANELLAKGKDDSAERHLFKNAAKLTGQEEALLKSTAADQQTALTAFAASAGSIMSGLKAQYPSKSALPASAAQQLQSLDARRKQISQTHMAALQAGMTAARFQQFYNFAFGTEGPRIRLAQPGPKPRAGAPV